MKSLKYDMHRPECREGDWQLLSEDNRNIWQQIASETNGVVTPANAIDVLSVAAEVKVQKDLVSGHENMISASSSNPDEVDADDIRQIFLDGAQRKMTALKYDGGLALVDKLDGMIASNTGTSSRIGEYVDASRDAMVTVMKLASRWRIGEISSADLMMLGGPKLLNIVATGIETARGREVHTSLVDKGNEALRALTIVSFDARELIKTQYQVDAVNDGALPHEAVRPEVYERGLYLQADKVQKELLGAGFASGALAGAIKLTKSASCRNKFS